MAAKASIKNLLPFHESIIQNIHDPTTSELLLLARGLGLRKIVCSLLKIYDSPRSLVLLVNATQEEEAAIGEELGIMGCRKPGLRIVGYEMGKKDRQVLYNAGGIMSVTSRILIVDMLQSDIPTELVTGIIVLHAERVTALSLEAFIVRLYREKNKAGFLKAFTDQPEHITSGISPLKNIMKELQLRTVHIYPRFHEDIKQSLERRRADVIELYQPMTESMTIIHEAIVQCITSTLSDLKRANTTLDLDDFKVENVYFRSFEAVVRRQLDPVWHKVGARTKQLVSDLATLRRLLDYLLSYDALAFHAYLETIIASNTTAPSGEARQHQSPWLLTDAANAIFQTAKRRCYVTRVIPKPRASARDLADDEEGWEALDEIQGTRARPIPQPKRKPWLPEDMEPVLEELPKWSLLADVLKEIEEEMIRQEGLGNPHSRGSNTVLIMTSSTRNSTLVNEFLSNMDADAEKGSQGRKMMERRLRMYLWWKGQVAQYKQESRDKGRDLPQQKTDNSVSEALRKKDKERQDRSANRRRVRGGAPGVASTSSRNSTVAETVRGENEMRHEAENIADFLSTQNPATEDAPVVDDDDIALQLLDENFLAEFDDNYGLLAPAQTIVVRAYSDDSDDQTLWEIQPRFIVLFDPNQDFVRRIEVYRSLSPGLGVRVYFMIYKNSCEEHKYLAGLRKEKESFERLIKERGTMLLPIYEDRSVTPADSMIRTISSRVAGGQKDVTKGPSQVIVDMREFRSTLPSLLHASRLLVIPATLTVGDYILTPDICVERKSIPDLVSSFNSGRLYTQCEIMSAHYKQPILLIEFEENKSFSLETVSDLKSFAKSTGKYPAKKGGPSSAQESKTYAPPSIQSKLVLLTLTFPRVRIIWSSSPYATADIFNDLKLNNLEPDPAKAISIGAEEDPEAGAGVNSAAEELLRSLPGITSANMKKVMAAVSNMRQFTELPLEEVQKLLGKEPGKLCWEFMHKGDARS